MNNDTSTDWRQLYREALFEPEPEKLLARIAEAYYAMQCRARELWYEGSSNGKERAQMDAACGFLELLEMMAGEKAREHTQRIVARELLQDNES